MPPKDVKKYWKPGISIDILEAWAKINYTYPSDKDDILDQYLWFNSHIKDPNGSLLLFKHWHKAGLNQIRQLFDSSGFRSLASMNNQFGKVVNFLEYERIKKAIPKEWVRAIKRGVKMECQVTALEIVKDVKKCSNIVYNNMVQRMEISTIMRFKWEAWLDYEISDKMWASVYEDVRRLTLSTKLRFFPDRLVYGYLITNTRLVKCMKISDKCSFCNEKPEDYVHLFVNCSYVYKLWCALKKWLYYFCF